MQQVLLTVDLGFGDAGKGSIVDFLTRVYAAHTVVRYNGGAQAGHRVVTAGLAPQEHIFAQFGSGTLAGAATHLSRFMLLDPLAMVEEEKHLRMLGVIDAFQRTTIDAQGGKEGAAAGVMAKARPMCCTRFLTEDSGMG